MTAASAVVYEHADTILRERPFYGDYRAGRIGASRYAREIDASVSSLIEAGVAPGDVPFLKRRPPDDRQAVADILSDLRRRGLLCAVDWDEAGFSRHARKMRTEFEHDGRRTYIASEEAMLMYALVDLIRPKRVAFLGSYYGYWAFWALPTLARHGGTAVLIDIDEPVSMLSARNVRQFAYEGSAEVVTADACEWMSQAKEQYDMLVLDAECPLTHPDPAVRGKRIYAPLLRAGLAALAPRGWVICHNILVSHAPADPDLDAIIERNLEEYRDFFQITGEHLEGFFRYDTTEGIGIGTSPGRAERHGGAHVVPGGRARGCSTPRSRDS
ncbi:class I SAM-dependent methyltransferase [Sorangium sp. So ce1182]|uniref:class I SAM-dependent methyltransferase n=1 Tax=Sorangium sp. So ce1182 TaxID=3133334 RepID=UPI003F5F5246